MLDNLLGDEEETLGKRNLLLQKDAINTMDN